MNYDIVAAWQELHEVIGNITTMQVLLSRQNATGRDSKNTGKLRIVAHR